jgi:lambda family phage portal protein
VARIEPLNLRGNAKPDARGLVRRTIDAVRGAVTGFRTLTSESTLAQLGGASGWGGFQAAKMGRLVNDWPSSSRSADQDLMVDLRRLRARARNQAMNSPIAAKFLGMVRSNVVGQHGVKLAFKVQKLRKGKGGDLDDTINDKLHAAWKEWGKRGSCTVCGRYSWRELQRVIVENAARDGECLLGKVNVPKSVNPFGFQLQLIDADQLDDNYNLLGRADGTQIRMGVEVNAQQRPMAYHLFKGNPYEVTFSSGARVRVPADQIIHFFISHRTGQTRGYPWFAATMNQLNMLDGYFFAELTGARISSSLLASIESENNPEFQGDGVNKDGSQAYDVGYGKLLELGPGQSLKNNTPTHPTTAFSEFVQQSGRIIASGMGVAYHKLCSNLSGVNMSSARIGEMEERDFWMELQSHLIDDVLEPIYDAWLPSALLNGAIDLSIADRKRYAGTALKWEPRRWGWFDPLKDVQAATLQVQNGFENHESIAMAQGKDYVETFKQLALEQELADELGIQLGTDIRGQATSEINAGDPVAEEAVDENGDPKDGTPAKPAKPKVRPTPAPAKAKAAVK